MLSNLGKYLLVFLISMIPVLELRGALPIAIGMGLPTIPSIIVSVLGNMLPVPFIYLFARKFLIWGSKQKIIGRFCAFCVQKGEKASQKLNTSAGKRGMFIALMIFVGTPLPGTGAWTGTLAASFLNLDGKTTAISVCCGVILAGIIMTIVSLTGIHIFGL
ncbi:MAG: small multi-drug export protein [Bacteroidaceae bacterium]|nr:small multi-drug export protein [Bacteroidaceae bacterium]